MVTIVQRVLVMLVLVVLVVLVVLLVLYLNKQLLQELALLFSKEQKIHCVERMMIVMEMVAAIHSQVVLRYAHVMKDLVV